MSNRPDLQGRAHETEVLRVVNDIQAWFDQTREMPFAGMNVNVLPKGFARIALTSTDDFELG